MKKTVIISSIAIIMAIIAINGAYAQQYDSENDFDVDITENAVTISLYLGSKKEVRIPPRIQNLPVAVIGREAFTRYTILVSVTIPNSVTSIEKGAFDGCTGLTEINVASGNTAYSSQDGVLYNLDKTNLLKYPEKKSDASFTIPKSVIGIGQGAFQSASITSVIIPNSVKSIANDAFAYCTRLNNVIIPNSVTSIGANAFSYCARLTSVTIPNSVKSIELQVFNDCTNLTDVTIPNSVTSIGQGAFQSTGLNSITIPSSVKSIGNYAFWNCNSLTNVTFQGIIPSKDFNTYAFDKVGGDLRDKYLAGGPGTYKRSGNYPYTWTKN